MQTNFRFFQLPHHKSPSLSPLYIASNMRFFVFSFLSLLLPIIILNNYLHLGQKTAIILTLLFFMGHSVSHFLAVIPAIKIASRFGLKFNFLIAQIFLLIFFFLFYKKIFFLSFFVFGLASAFWWFSYHLFFVKIGDKDFFGRQVGLAETFGALTGAIGPFCGALILAASGEKTFLFTAGLFIIISFIAIFFLYDVKKTSSVSIAEIEDEFFKRPGDFVAFIGAGAEEIIYSVAWPLLLFFVFNDILSVGGLASMIAILAGLAYYISGVIVDKMNKEQLEKIGVVAIFSSWIGRAFFQNPLALSVFEAVRKTFNCLFIVPLRVIAYNHALKEKEKYVGFREMSYRIGNILALVCFITIITLDLPFWLIFIAAGIFALFPAAMKK